MTTPKQFEEQMIKAVESGNDNMQIISLCIGAMTETLDSLGYSAGVEVLKKYLEHNRCK